MIKELRELLTTKTPPQPKKENGFYQEIKRAVEKLPDNIILTRIENWMTLGIPDLLVCDAKGKISFYRIKSYNW